MTPDDAEKLLCPLSMAAADRGTYCVADNCMAWRWVFDRATVMEMQRADLEAKGYHALSAHTSSSGIPMLTMVRQTEHGYCGMAAKPEAVS